MLFCAAVGGNRGVFRFLSFSSLTGEDGRVSRNRSPRVFVCSTRHYGRNSRYCGRSAEKPLQNLLSLRRQLTLSCLHNNRAMFFEWSEISVPGITGKNSVFRDTPHPPSHNLEDNMQGVDQAVRRRGDTTLATLRQR